MVRFLAALLLASSALLAVAQVSHAEAPWIAEEFWRRTLPNSGLPEAVLWHLRPDTSFDSMAEGTGGGDDTIDAALNNCAGPALSGKWSQFFGSYTHKQGSPSHMSSGHSHMPAAGDSTATKMRSLFFHEEAVQVGRSLPFFSPPAKRPRLGMLPRDAADSIPFSASALPDILARLGVAVDSDQAADMEETLSMCETPPVAGEPKFCATSLETLVEGSMAALNTRDIMPVTSMLPRSGAPWQPYTIRSVRPVVVGEGSRFVGCHQVVYPYTVYKCHGTGLARLYMVEMEGTGGGIVC